MRFEGQHDDEKVLFFFRQHPVVLRRPLLVFLALFTVSLLPFSFNPLARWTQLTALGGLVVSLIIFIYFWMSWYFSLYIVTTMRIIQDTQKGLFGKQVVELDLDKIQNVNYEIPGFQASIFKFGTIVIQTFVGDLVIEKVHHPNKIQRKLSRIIRDYGGDTPDVIG